MKRSLKIHPRYFKRLLHYIVIFTRWPKK